MAKQKQEPWFELFQALEAGYRELDQVQQMRLVWALLDDLDSRDCMNDGSGDPVFLGSAVGRDCHRSVSFQLCSLMNKIDKLEAELATTGKKAKAAKEALKLRKQLDEEGKPMSYSKIAKELTAQGDDVSPEAAQQRVRHAKKIAARTMAPQVFGPFPLEAFDPPASPPGKKGSRKG